MAIVEISINIASDFMGIIDGQLILMVIPFELEIDFVIGLTKGLREIPASSPFPSSIIHVP
jgi:hypothetical protein